MIFMSPMMSFCLPSWACSASGKACATPWSVIAIARWPHCAARHSSAAVELMPSIALMLVCKCSSTRFIPSALSCRTGFFALTMPVGSKTISLA